jgi:peroxiredoxin Q/BCP
MSIPTRIGAALLAAGLLSLTFGTGLAAEVNVGDKAPSFEGTDEQGKAWKSDDHFAKKVVVIYFYPADFTGGCTKQACAFRDDSKKLADKGVEVVGISGDSSKTHAMFKDHHKLPFTLIADEDGSIAKKFGVPFTKGREIKVKVDDKEITTNPGVLISRWTFVVKDGKVVHKETKVNAAGDSKAVLEVVEKLDK